MFGVLAAAVVDAAAGDDEHVAVFADVEVVVDRFLQAGGADDDGNVHALVFGAGSDADVDARTVGLGTDFDVGGVGASRQLPVGAEIVRARRDFVQIGHLRQQAFLDLVQLHHG